MEFESSMDLTTQISEQFQLFLIATFISMMTFSYAWKKNFFHLGHTHYVVIHGLDVLKAFGYFILAQVVIVPAFTVVLFGLLYNQKMDNFMLTNREQAFVNMLAIFGGLSAVMGAFFSLHPYQRRDIWGHNSSWFHNILVGIATWFVSYPFVLAFNQFISIMVLIITKVQPIDQTAVKHFKHILNDPLLFFINGLGVVLIVPIAEELLFRGFLQSWLKEKFKDTKKGIVLASIVFAFFHFSPSQGISNIELISSLFVLSCFLGFIYERQKSLWASIGLHAFFNAMSLIMIIFED